MYVNAQPKKATFQNWIQIMTAFSAVASVHSLTTIRILGIYWTYLMRNCGLNVFRTCVQTTPNLYQSKLGNLRKYDSKGQALIMLVSKVSLYGPIHLNSGPRHLRKGLMLEIIEYRWLRLVRIRELNASLFYLQVNSKSSHLYLIRTIASTSFRMSF